MTGTEIFCRGNKWLRVQPPVLAAVSGFPLILSHVCTVFAVGLAGMHLVWFILVWRYWFYNCSGSPSVYYCGHFGCRHNLLVFVWCCTPFPDFIFFLSSLFCHFSTFLGLHVTLKTMRLRIRKPSRQVGLTHAPRPSQPPRTKRRHSEVEACTAAVGRREDEAGLFSSIRKFIRGTAVKVSQWFPSPWVALGFPAYVVCNTCPAAWS